MTDRIDENPPMSIPDEAAEWLLRWHCGDLSIAERFEYLQWLKTSPVHIAETLRMCRLYSWLAGTKLKLFITNEDTFSNVVELPRERAAGNVGGASSTWSGLWKVRMAAAVTAIGLTALLALAVKTFWFDHSLQTMASEWRSVPLSDGSSITAGPYTRLHHDIGGGQRVINLAEGLAVFRVAKDPSRPFMVDAGRVVVTATGTKFTVERHGSDVIVTMHEGTVLVTPAASGEATFSSESLTADQRWSLAGSQAPTIDAVDGEEEQDWSRGQLKFRTGDTIGGAAAKFNKFNAIKIVVDEQVRERQIRGAFDAIDPLSFAATVETTTAADGVSVVRESPELIRIKRPEPHR